MFTSSAPVVHTGATKSELYNQLVEQARSLIGDEPDFIANAANFSALVYHSIPDLNWAGFYFLKDNELVLGPFQGQPACIRIKLGQGVCGTAVQQRQTIVVPNVHDFPGHIACDSASKSEIVVPLIKNEKLLGVFDVDSPLVGRFDDEDAKGFKKLVHIFIDTIQVR